MPWIPVADAGLSPYFGGSGNFSVSGSSIVSSGGIGTSDNNFGMTVPDVAPYDDGGMFAIRFTCVSFSAAADGETFGLVKDPFGTPVTQLNESATPNAEFLPSPFVMQFSSSGGAGFADFATTGPADPSAAGEFLIEIFQVEPAAPAEPLLRKDSAKVIVAPAVAAVPSVPAIGFYMYAPPPPLGWQYRQYSTAATGGRLLPDNQATFDVWPQYRQAPEEYAQVLSYEFKTLAQIFGGGSGGVDSTGFIPVYGIRASDGAYVITGYMVPTYSAAPLPPRFHGPIAHMTYITFPDVATEGPFGYPAGPGPFTGYYDVPTLSGLLRVTNLYVKDVRGTLLRVSGDPVPPYCTLGGPCRVVALSNFPGRPSAPAVPEIAFEDMREGWNAGANSIAAIEGDCRVTFTPDIKVAGAVGLTAANRDPVTSPNNLSHAFYFDQDPTTGSLRFGVIEFGLRKANFGPAAEGDYVIERVSGMVTYSFNGAPLYASEIYLPGAVRVGTALYRAGDGIV